MVPGTGWKQTAETSRPVAEQWPAGRGAAVARETVGGPGAFVPPGFADGARAPGDWPPRLHGCVPRLCDVGVGGQECSLGVEIGFSPPSAGNRLRSLEVGVSEHEADREAPPPPLITGAVTRMCAVCLPPGGRTACAQRGGGRGARWTLPAPAPASTPQENASSVSQEALQALPGCSLSNLNFQLIKL